MNSSISKAENWVEVKLPQLHKKIGKVCHCGNSKCGTEDRFYDLIKEASQLAEPTKSLFVTNGHSTYSEVDWLASQISSSKAEARIISVVRPARARVVSMFRDYWDQVSKAESGTEKVPPHRVLHAKTVQESFLADAAHYRDETGRIDGRRWFSSFAQYRGGITFQLNQIFDQKPEVLAKALASGRLTAIPTVELDATLEKMTGNESVRRRVSSTPSDHLSAAIEESADLIDTIAAFDEPFDAVLADHLGIERFDPKRAR